MIYINTRFPKNKLEYNKAADENTNELIERIQSIVVREPPAKAIPQVRPRIGGMPWIYADQKKKAKTFTLK